MGFEGIGEGKKTKMVTPFRNMARSFTCSWTRSLARSDEGGAGEGWRLHEGEAVYEALPLALQRFFYYKLTKWLDSLGTLAKLINSISSLQSNQVFFDWFRAAPSFLEPIEGGLGPGRGEWPSGQKRQTVNLLKFFYVGSNPASPTCLL